MELIEHYQPEYVVRFRTRETACECPACLNGSENWPYTGKTIGSQQRDSLNAACESAAREILLNPQAFVLHAGETAATGDCAASQWNETLNQQCINMAVQPALTLETSLYAIGVLLSKAQRYLDEKEHDPQKLVEMGEQLSQLAEGGVLQQQFSLLPPIEANRAQALGLMGGMRLNLNLPPMQKMMFMLKLSELAVMEPARLTERLRELEAKPVPLLAEQPHILRNMLLYRLYEEFYPGPALRNYGEALMSLTRQFFQLKMLFAMWQEVNDPVTEADIVALYSAWYGWQQQNPAPADPVNTADYVLLCGLSLI